MADTSKKADKAKKTDGGGKKADDKGKKAEAPPAEILNINELGTEAPRPPLPAVCSGL